jgi:hypothetical protein
MREIFELTPIKLNIDRICALSSSPQKIDDDINNANNKRKDL